MEFHFSEGQLAALIGALVGGGIAVTSQIVFYILGEQRRLHDNRLALTRQRLDEFYSPLLTRLLEIEYKLWLDHEAQHSSAADFESQQQKEIWEKQLSADIAALDREIIDIFRSKRWLAFDSTVVECQKLVRYLESTKLSEALPGSKIAVDWGDVVRLKDLHIDVRKHHICLLEDLGMEKCGALGLVPEGADGFRVEGELSLDKYNARLEQKSGRASTVID